MDIQAACETLRAFVEPVGARGEMRPRTFSQRDETGMTRAIVPLLAKHNITAISLGSGGSWVRHPVLPGSRQSDGGPAKVMGVFRWLDKATNTEVLFTADHGYTRFTHV